MPLHLTPAAAALALALASPVAAQEAPRCYATATPPTADSTAPRVRGTGTFGCVTPSFDLFVTVCIEELDPTVSTAWTTLGCASTVQNDGGTVTGEVSVEAPDHTTLLRTTVTGSNEHGDTASGTSAPVPWVRCGCP